MRIVAPRYKSPLPSWFGRHRSHLLIGALLLAGVLVVFLAGAQAQKAQFFGRVVRPIIGANVDLPARWWAGFNNKPPHLAISIKFKHLKMLEQERNEALNQQVLFASSDNYVPATMNVDGESYPIKIRLKGDSTEHLGGRKWSFRIKLKGDSTLFGMKQFSVHHPQTRNWIHEWVMHRWMKHEGLLALRYRFVEASINGDSLGIYALEEHFDHRLLEHQTRRNGPIIRFSEGPMWREIAEQLRAFPGAEPSGYGTYEASPIDGFKVEKLAEDPVSWHQYQTAVRLLDDFRRGVLEPKDVFDVDKLGTFLALVDIIGAHHGALWHNMRFYYNPVSGRLEPISFDGNSGQPLHYPMPFATWRDEDDGEVFTAYQSYWARLIDDEQVSRAYVQALERITRPGYLEGLLADLDEEMRESLAVIWREFPQYRFDSSVYYRNQAYLRTVLEPPHALHARIQGLHDGTLRVGVANLQQLPLQVEDLVIGDGRTLRGPAAITLKRRAPGDVLQRTRLEFIAPEVTAEMLPNLGARIRYRVLGASRSAWAIVEAPLPKPQWKLTGAPVRRPDNVASHAFLSVDEATGRVMAAPGAHRVDHDVIIGPGRTVHVGPGTSFDLVEGSLILSRSPLNWIGTEGQPIRVHSSDATGQGLVVLTASAASELKHVRFEGLGNPDRPDWTLTGAVTFYESPVRMIHCESRGNRSEDAINFIRMTFSMQHTTIAETASDAFDADFCEGEIINSTFLACGNDCIDVSGSEVVVRGVKTKGAQDKAVSAGEASNVLIEYSRLEGAAVGLVSKDRSSLIARHVDVVDCKYGLAAFQKKPEFGPARLEVSKCTISASNGHLIQPGSSATIDGVALPADTADVYGILYK